MTKSSRRICQLRWCDTTKNVSKDGTDSFSSCCRAVRPLASSTPYAWWCIAQRAVGVVAVVTAGVVVASVQYNRLQIPALLLVLDCCRLDQCQDQDIGRAWQTTRTQILALSLAVVNSRVFADDDDSVRLLPDLRPLTQSSASRLGLKPTDPRCPQRAQPPAARRPHIIFIPFPFRVLIEQLACRPLDTLLASHPDTLCRASSTTQSCAMTHASTMQPCSWPDAVALDLTWRHGGWARRAGHRGTFLTFWLNDQCRNNLLSFIPRKDLASLRLACHDFSVRAAPALFSKLQTTFRASTFTKPARLAALDRLGFYVKTLKFTIPHTVETFLPPLVDPETGAELNFTYTPQLQSSAARPPKYGDVGTTEILTRQYPPLFHASTNVTAFIRAMSAFVNLAHLNISCPGFDGSRRHRRSIVDFALISLRIAIEQNCLNSLDSLTLSPIHPSGLLYLSPVIGYGATPRSASRWARIRNLTIHCENLALAAPGVDECDQFKMLQKYLCNFKNNLTTFNFRWVGEKGPLPVQRPMTSVHMQHPAQRATHQPTPRHSTQFPRIQIFHMENVKTSATDISAFAASHKKTLCELDLEDVVLSSGTWDEALAPLTQRARRHRPPRMETAEIPIMLSPSAICAPFPVPMARVDVSHEANGRRSLRLSRFLPSRNRRPVPSHRLRDGLLECEEHLRKALKSEGPSTFACIGTSVSIYESTRVSQQRQRHSWCLFDLTWFNVIGPDTRLGIRAICYHDCGPIEYAQNVSISTSCAEVGDPWYVIIDVCDSYHYSSTLIVRPRTYYYPSLSRHQPITNPSTTHSSITMSLKDDSFPSSVAFDQIASALSSDAEKKDAVKKGGAIFAFQLKNSSGQEKAWYIDLKETGTVGQGAAPAGKKAGITMILSEENFAKLIAGKANAQKLFMGGKLKVKGDVMKATKIEPVLKKVQANSKL
nr:fatty acid-binding protein [Quercus suber]